MTVNVYSSFDAGAPVLTGEAGSLIAVLDACLVAGYGSKAAAGWTKPFVGTNIAVFRPGAGEQSYYQIKDDGVDGTNGTKNATVYIYETMTDAVTGTGKTPASYTANHYIHLPKSTTQDATQREWKVYASNKACYVLTKCGIVTWDAYHISFFGEYARINPTYGSPSITAACTASAVANSAITSSPFFVIAGATTPSDTVFFLRDATVNSKVGGFLTDNANVSSSITSFRNGGMLFSPVLVRTNESITAGAGAILGFVPGAFTSYAPFAGNNTTIEFTNGAYSGREFTVATAVATAASSFACIYIETTPDAW